MTRRWRLRALVAALVLQVLVLLGLLGYARYPVWFGKEVVLRTVPVDPRDLLRGNYARLRYDISEAPMPEVGVPRVGREVYVQLRRKGRVWKAVDTRYSPPPGDFIRGHIRAVRVGSVTVEYGIEAYFAPKDKALELERRLRQGGLARVRIATDGRAALVSVEDTGEGTGEGAGEQP